MPWLWSLRTLLVGGEGGSALGRCAGVFGLQQPSQILAGDETGNAESSSLRAAGVESRAPGLSAYVKCCPQNAGASAPFARRASGLSMMAGMGKAAAPEVMSAQRTYCLACNVPIVSVRQQRMNVNVNVM